MPKDDKKSNKNKLLPDSIPLPIGVTIGQIKDRVTSKGAPMPAKEHQDKAKKLGTKSRDALSQSNRRKKKKNK